MYENYPLAFLIKEILHFKMFLKLFTQVISFISNFYNSINYKTIIFMLQTYLFFDLSLFLTECPNRIDYKV